MPRTFHSFGHRCRNSLSKHKNKILKMLIMKEQQTSATVVAIINSDTFLLQARRYYSSKSKEKSKPANGLSRISPPSPHRKCGPKVFHAGHKAQRQLLEASLLQFPHRCHHSAIPKSSPPSNSKVQTIDLCLV